MDEKCVFCKIVKGEIPAKKVYEDEGIVVLDDIKPKAPIHYLIIPTKHIESFDALQDLAIWERMADTAQRLIVAENLTEKGYRLVVNGGPAALIGHLHMHLLGDLGPED